MPQFSCLSIASIALDRHCWPTAAVACGVQSGDSSDSSWLLFTRAGGLAEAGDVVQAIAEGAITAEHVLADLAALCRGTHPGRQSADQITAFKSVGWAGEDLAATVLAYGAGSIF